MNNKFANFVMFTVGAAIGSAVTWKLIKSKYEQIANEEIEAVKMYYRKKAEKQPDDNTLAHSNANVKSNKIELEEYSKKLREELGYDQESEKGELDIRIEPYVISPNEFDGNGYETESLTYYSDGILADELGNIIHDVDERVGEESLEHFGEYEDDAVHVRNESLGIEYEILLVEKTYSDVHKPDPFSAENLNDD